jgi:hypothetical protein
MLNFFLKWKFVGNDFFFTSYGFLKSVLNLGKIMTQLNLIMPLGQLKWLKIITITVGFKNVAELKLNKSWLFYLSFQNQIKFETIFLTADGFEGLWTILQTRDGITARQFEEMSHLILTPNFATDPNIILYGFFNFIWLTILSWTISHF